MSQVIIIDQTTGDYHGLYADGSTYAEMNSPKGFLTEGSADILLNRIAEGYVELKPHELAGWLVMDGNGCIQFKRLMGIHQNEIQVYGLIPVEEATSFSSLVNGLKWDLTVAVVDIKNNHVRFLKDPFAKHPWTTSILAAASVSNQSPLALPFNMCRKELTDNLPEGHYAVDLYLSN